MSNRSLESNDLFQSSHLMLLVSYTAFAVLLIGESLIMGWERWVLILIAMAVIFCWIMHFRQDSPPAVRIRIYSVLMMCTAFFYGIHTTSTFDLAIVMSAVMMIYTMTGMKSLITMCQITYYITMTYGLIMMGLNGEEFDPLVISRIILHLALIFFIGWFAKIVIDKWSLVLSSSKDEVAQLTEATERLNDFLANVSHEIRTPVNAVIGLTGICIEKSQNRGVMNDLIAVREAGHKVADQISDILDYSEIDRKKAVCNNEDYMLSSVLHDLVTDIRRNKSKDVELIIDVDPAIPAVMNSDVAKLKKILKALISNGLKYTRKGGVYVRIVAEEHDYGVNLCIEVTDTGIGMTEYELERVYDSFYQADSGRSRMGGGLGLGLAIVSGFVSLLGGFMTIKSKVDVGTTVNVSIPQKVIDPTSCMSVSNPDKICLGGYLHFEKYSDPAVRDYYNSMVLNIVKGLGIQMHRVNNAENLKLLHKTIHMTHLFIAEEEYGANVELMEELAGDMIVVVVANEDIVLPEGSRVRIMEKPFYCFPVVSVLNSSIDDEKPADKKMYCRDVKALVVDDESMNLVVAKSIFRRYGMKVTTVLSGPEAIEICREKVFDIIFMDHMMGGMDGVEAMKRIRSDVSGRNSDVPIVALTANAMSSAKQMFLSEGFDGFVSKPIDTEELERVMRMVLPKSAVTFETEAIPVEELLYDRHAPEAEENTEVKTDINDPIVIHTELKRMGIDSDTGLKYCAGDLEFYKSLLIQFASEADSKIQSMRHSFENDNIHDYEIVVHALKSTSKMIGALELSEFARELEAAAKENRDDYINQNHKMLVRRYTDVVSSLKDLFGVTDDPEAPGSDENGSVPSENEDDEVFEFDPGGDPDEGGQDS
ncbi:MAG: response regulator, partial [Clostridiales bacterium]|nr:response regulator [Clostridiales bacterium]